MRSYRQVCSNKRTKHSHLIGYSCYVIRKLITSTLHKPVTIAHKIFQRMYDTKWSALFLIVLLITFTSFLFVYEYGINLQPIFNYCQTENVSQQPVQTVTQTTTCPPPCVVPRPIVS